MEKIKNIKLPNGEVYELGGSGLDGKITNCITEIPQRIKLELNNGTLTLKAGSEVIVPNGFEADGVTPKFDYVTLQNDLGVSTGAGQNVLFVKFDGSAIPTVSLARATSGNTDVLSNQTYHAWYDTKNNIVKRYGSDASTYIQVSFPIVIATFADATTCNNIDQVFNGFGYIGSTVWVDKGVKGLIPNGRNEDGTLKNIEFVTDKVTKYDITAFTDLNTTLVGLTKNSDGLFATARSLYQGEHSVHPTPVQYASYYNKVQNKWYTCPSGTAWVEMSYCNIGNLKLSRTNDISTVSSLQPKQPFRAVDYSEYRTEMDINNAKVSSPITAICTTRATTTSSASSKKPAVVVTNYVNGASWYRVWSDGWIEQGGVVSTTVDSQGTITLIKSHANTNYSSTITLLSTTTTTNNEKAGSIWLKSKTTSNMSFVNDLWPGSIEWHTCGY